VREREGERERARETNVPSHLRADSAAEYRNVKTANDEISIPQKGERKRRRMKIARIARNARIRSKRGEREREREKKGNVLSLRSIAFVRRTLEESLKCQSFIPAISLSKIFSAAMEFLASRSVMHFQTRARVRVAYAI